jgi:outer membrane protein assembly factor BamB
MARLFATIGQVLPAFPLFLGSCGGPSGPEVGGVRERWYQAQTGYSRARPATNGTVVYFGTGDGSVAARDMNTGSLLWISKVSRDAINGANLVVSANVVVAPSVFQTFGLDAQTGQQLWSYEAPDDTVGVSPSAASPGTLTNSRIDADNQVVYIPAWGASVSALELRTGAVRWVWQPGLIAGDTLFSTLWHFTNRVGGTAEAWLVALDKNSGAELWRTKLPYQGSGVLVETAPALSGNLVIVHLLSGRTYAVDRTTRQIAWEFSVPGYTLSTLAGPEVSAGIAYVDGGDSQIYALRASDGSVAWKGSFGSQTTRDLLVTDRHIIFPTGAELHILDRQSGQQVAVVVQPHTSDPLFASAAAFANGLVFTSVGGGAWCFEEPH